MDEANGSDPDGITLADLEGVPEVEELQERLRLQSEQPVVRSLIALALLASGLTAGRTTTVTSPMFAVGWAATTRSNRPGERRDVVVIVTVFMPPRGTSSEIGVRW